MTRKKRLRRRSSRAASPRSEVALEKIIIADAVRFIHWPNVRQISLGWKEKGGRVTRRLSVKVHVTEKRELADLAPHHQLPKSTTILIPMGGGQFVSRRVPIDVIWHAPPTLAATPSDFLNPIPSGALIGAESGGLGTYAGVVRDKEGNRFHLTAGHVVQGALGEIVPDLSVLQPPAGTSIPAGANPEFGRTAGGFFGNTDSGFVDFAVISASASRGGTSRSLDGVPIVPQIIPSSQMSSGPLAVSKLGALTGRTHGVVAGLVHATTVDGLFVTNVWVLLGTDDMPFGERGDSGSLVISDAPGTAGMVVGILFAVAQPTPDAPAGRGYVVPFDRLPVRPV